MTITPSKAREMTEEERETIGRLEKKIDETIMKEFGNCSSGISYAISQGSGMTRRVVNEITKMYTEAGWNVRYESDQRDGTYLYFTPKGGTQ
jgi:hypothetical protein